MSDGAVVAVSEYGFDFSSFVKIYKLDVQSSEWVQQGRDIKASYPSQAVGIGISLSSDGLVLAIGDSAELPIQIYKFNENHEWVQFGYDISLPSPGYFILPKLSASGRTLTLTAMSSSYQKLTYIFVSDELSQLWIQSPMNLPLLKPPMHSAIQSILPYIAASADLWTIGFQSGYSIKAYRLIVQSTGSTITCSNNEILFNCTIKPDQFPEDIEWILQTRNQIISGARLRPVVCSKEVNYKQCIPRRKEYYLFYIGDCYGDGICCEWGQGHFVLNWDNMKVLDSFEFKYIKSLCLSNDNSRLSLFSIIFDIYPKRITWSLLNSNFEKEMQGTGTDLLEERVFFQCLPRNECL